MFQDVFNFFFIFGYENVLWMLGVDVGVQLFVCIFNRMCQCSNIVVVLCFIVFKDIFVKFMMSLSLIYFKNVGVVLLKGGIG